MYILPIATKIVLTNGLYSDREFIDHIDNVIGLSVAPNAVGTSMNISLCLDESDQTILTVNTYTPTVFMPFPMYLNKLQKVGPTKNRFKLRGYQNSGGDLTFNVTIFTVRY